MVFCAKNDNSPGKSQIGSYYAPGRIMESDPPICKKNRSAEEIFKNWSYFLKMRRRAPSEITSCKLSVRVRFRRTSGNLRLGAGISSFMRPRTYFIENIFVFPAESPAGNNSRPGNLSASGSPFPTETRLVLTYSAEAAKTRTPIRRVPKPLRCRLLLALRGRVAQASWLPPCGTNSWQHVQFVQPISSFWG